MNRKTVALAVAATMSVAVPSAEAATLKMAGSGPSAVAKYTAGPGHRNALLVTPIVGGLQFMDRQFSDRIAASGGCTALGPFEASCPTVASLAVYLGDGADHFDGSTLASRPRVTVIGGDGNDSVTSGAGPDRLFGGPGDDHLFSGPGNDYARGDAGKDRLDCGSGIGDEAVADWADVNWPLPAVTNCELLSS